MLADMGLGNTWEMDRRHFIHPYTDFSTFHEEGSHVISSSRGVHVCDSEGRQFLDAVAGLWCVNIGHGRREMAQAIADQVMRMQYYNPFGHCTNEPAARLSAKLAELAPAHLNHVFYSSGGSSANDVAARLAHYYHEMRGEGSRKVILSRKDAYHGSTYFAASLTGIEGTKTGFNQVAEDIIVHLSAANLYRRPQGKSEADYCDQLVDEFECAVRNIGPRNIAAFFAEPIMGAGGVLVAPRDYHRRIDSICKANGILYIADEVVTGFGRLGDWFVSESQFGVKADLIVTAKGLSSGYVPIGATLVSDAVYDTISKPQAEGATLSMGFTYSGHPVACAAALKNIEIIEREDLLQHMNDVGPNLLGALQSLSKLDIVGDIRGSHFMAGIEFVSNKDSRSSFNVSAKVAHRVFKRCLQRGVIVRPVGNVIALSPPLIFEQADCRRVADVLKHSVEETAAELRVAGHLGEAA